MKNKPGHISKKVIIFFVVVMSGTVAVRKAFAGWFDDLKKTVSETASGIAKSDEFKTLKQEAIKAGVQAAVGYASGKDAATIKKETADALKAGTAKAALGTVAKQTGLTPATATTAGITGVAGTAAAGAVGAAAAKVGVPTAVVTQATNLLTGAVGNAQSVVTEATGSVETLQATIPDSPELQAVEKNIATVQTTIATAEKTLATPTPTATTVSNMKTLATRLPTQVTSLSTSLATANEAAAAAQVLVADVPLDAGDIPLDTGEVSLEETPVDTGEAEAPASDDPALMSDY